ncbi:MarR family transcriptional regulator [Pseudenhygromyxa sp. WMMC2535]|uniref:GbsR/MarR family transcriptional regulator n=1 Tax=Pseudenhygromyxa sp. WMMC2535 TaxID=2712867 RepID=UPI0015959E68|nr:MarR family transcriptional regulator [Pseudenhygromyxa sp. WMMC2535]NVB40133.1 MarR family transcriptional regulator [Pseudenhygromyxa sp. WMMC2535]
MSGEHRQKLEEGVIASIARVCHIYGIPSNLGRLYAQLYLSTVPMSLAELAEASGAAKSTTSVALRRLERYRFVRRLPRGSDRRDYYEALTDPAEILREWARHFLQPEMSVGADMVADFERDLERAVAAGEYADDEAATLRERLEEMRGSMHFGQMLIETLSKGGPLPFEGAAPDLRPELQREEEQ